MYPPWLPVLPGFLATQKTSMSAYDAPISPEQADEGQLDRMYRRHRGWLLKFLSHRFGDLVGEDLAQEAFLRTLKSGAEVRNPRAFLAKVAVRAALEEARRRPEPGLAVVLPKAAQPDAEEAVLLEQAILSLPKPLREVFLLSRFGGLTNVEIAHRCNLSVKRVEARITRARAMLAAMMRD
jgi:RNA polymerase sigma-70 factor (ECF subfamily)